MKYLATSFLLALAAPAYAGDACPVGVTIVDLGVPAWLDRDAILADLSTTRTRVGIGYSFGDDGFVITRTEPGTPAETSGLLSGDIVLTIDGFNVESADTLLQVVDAAKPHETIHLRVSRDNEVVAIDLTLGATDPVPAMLAHVGSLGECRHSTNRHATESERAQFVPQLNDENRAFRCDDAHIDLVGNDQGATVYFVRGSRRVLLTFPDWGTVCVASQALDGADQRDNGAALLDELIGDFVADRIANP
ncbi:PDZ domain-containing protein [Octadecabacter temperatus]|uniref:PDZ domain (Also known as DHR or GLGF) n=1 Tax=Octadecabacter temperatus TaxID=1458307 RepID=A0A0K0Y5V5_9RHOB|nr:PDZ domain-containing protein [Octadecabacter temperatus]AKS46217.1 PDZ domain (Also known as DHR or GLGF) [Octadecabacter temperatus]SIO09868.1 PDZ domain-containing protein [Octadecabacter temperatus]